MSSTGRQVMQNGSDSIGYAIRVGSPARLHISFVRDMERVPYPQQSQRDGNLPRERFPLLGTMIAITVGKSVDDLIGRGDVQPSIRPEGDAGGTRDFCENCE